MNTEAAEAPANASSDATAGPDVFISYSRTDSEFVRRLHAALEAQGKDVWADWEDIRKGAEWWSRIQMGIESATAVVPVLTAAFVASRVCDDEIAHALASNKRVLPLQRAAIDDGPRQELRSLNWVDMRDDEHFDERVRELIEAVDTDLEWVDEHARLLVRASEWERRERDVSLLLRGSDLDAAELWLREQGSHREQATALQTEYLLAGRRAQSRRQRRLLVGVTVALVVSIGLGIVALLLRNQSIEREHVAVSRQLAATALGQLATDPETSLLLASRAAEEARTEQAERALRRALAVSHVRSARALELRRPADAMVSPGGDWALAIQRGGRVAAVDLGSGKTRRLSGPGVVGEDFGDDFEHREALAFARDGSVAAVAHVDGTVTAWRTDSWQRVARWRGPVASLRLDPRAGLALTIDPDTRAVVRRFPSGKVVADLGTDVYGAELAAGGRAIATLESKSEDYHLDVRLWFGPEFKRSRLLEAGQFQFSPDGRLIVTTEDGGIVVRSARTGRLVRNLAARCRCAVGRFSPDGRRLVASRTESDQVVLNARTWRVVGGFSVGSNQALHALSRDGRYGVYASQQGAPSVWDTAAGVRIATLRGHAGRLLAASMRDGRSVVTLSTDGTLRRWGVPSPVGEARVPGEIDAAALVADEIVAISREGRRLRVWRATVSPGARVSDARASQQIDGVLIFATISPDARFAAVRSRGGIAIWDLAHDPARALRTFGRVTRAAFSSDGRALVTGGADNREITVYATKSWTPMKRLSVENDVDTEPEIAVGPRGESVFVSPGERNAGVWDIRTGSRMADLGHVSSLYGMSFSPDGESLLLGPEDEPLRIHDVRSGAVVTELLGHASQAYTAQFSPDGKLVLTAGDGSIRLWDAASGEEIDARFTSDASLSGASFDPTGHRILTWGTGALRVYRCDVCGDWNELRQRARERVTRTLTRFERERFGVPDG